MAPTMPSLLVPGAPPMPMSGHGPDLTEYYRHVARRIASLPRSAHRRELGRLLIVLRLAGVAGDAVEVMESVLGEMASVTPR